MVPYESFGTVSYSPFIQTVALLYVVSVLRKRGILVKNRDFFHTPAFDAPITVLFGTEKLEWCGDPIVKKSLRICLAVSTEYRRLTDRQTDGQISCDSMVSIAL